jgi:putative transposase
LTGGVLREQGIAVAARSYQAWTTRAASARTPHDAVILDTFKSLSVREVKWRRRPEILYGSRKMTSWLARVEFPDVSKHAIDLLMRVEGLNALTRGRKRKSPTGHGKQSERAAGHLNRDFSALAPNHSWVTDFIYVATWARFIYVALAIDLFSKAVVGWSVSTIKDAQFVEGCLKVAMSRRDNAAAETGMGLDQNEAIAKGPPSNSWPLRGLTEAKELTFDWLYW